MALGDRKDPYAVYNFGIEVRGLVVGGFSEVSGLQIETEVQDYREGGLNEYIHRLAGPTRYPGNLILKHGLTDDLTLWNWYQQVRSGTISRKNISIVLMSRDGQEKRRWNFEKAYPVKWIGPDFRATSSEVAIEVLELAHCGLGSS